ncbi:MAG TPA: MBL fold metallo-hydrolase, partial [Alphaproteobacteria bacterium]|nr:MBL fold metallo-hydrolase [Alphaproteobacteria bacterium]
SSAAWIKQNSGEIEALGNISKMLICDMHYKDRSFDDLTKSFGAFTYCSEIEGPDVAKSVKAMRTFPFKRHKLEPDFEVIPAPGHRPGACCFLLTLKDSKVLFSGDVVFTDGKTGQAFPKSGWMKQMLATLDMLAGLDFDLLVCNGRASDPSCSVKLSTAAKRKAFFKAIAEKLV